MPSDTKPHPAQREVESHPDRPRNVNGEVDYEPHPEASKPLSDSRKAIMTKILNLYSGKASEENMAAYAEQAIYDDPFSYCDTRYVFQHLREQNTTLVTPPSTSHDIATKSPASGTVSPNSLPNLNPSPLKSLPPLLPPRNSSGNSGRSTRLRACM